MGLSDNEKIISKNKTAALNEVLNVAMQEQLIDNKEDISNAELDSLLEEIKTAHIAYTLFKRIKNE